MKRGSIGYLIIAAGAASLALRISSAQDVLRPFRPGDDDVPVRRATPVRPPSALPANPVDDGSAAPATPIPRATPIPKATPIPVRRAKPVKAAPEPPPAHEQAPAMAPEPSDPGEIRIAPQTGTKTADQVQLDVADNYYQRKMYDMAAPEYQRYIEQYPGQPDMQTALFRLALCYQKTGSVNAAKTSYEQLLDRFQTGEFIGPASYFLAELYYQDKNYAMALPLYRRATVRLKEPGVICAAKFFTARCLEGQGPLYRLEARAIYEELSATKENNLFRDASRMSYALLLYEGKNTAEALKQAESLMKETDNAQLQVEAAVNAGTWEAEQAQTEAEQGKKDKAAADFAKAAEDLKKSLEMPGIGRLREVAELGLVRIYYNSGKYQLVVETYAKLTQGPPDTAVEFSPATKPDLLLLTADAERQLSNFAEAIPLYDQIIKDYPATATAKEAAYQRIVCLYRSGDAKLGAEIDAFVANNAESENRDKALLMKAEGLSKKQDYPAAAQIYEQIAKSPRLSGTLRSEALTRLGYCLMEAKDYPRAIKAYTQLTDDFPTSKGLASALSYRALAYQAQKNFAAAEKDYDLLIRKYPQAAKERELALYHKALIRGQQNDNAGMAETFEQLLKDYPKSAVAPEAHFWIGSTAFDAKDYAKAATELDKARTLDPDQFFERATLRVMLSYYYQEDKTNVANEIDRYNKSGKSKPPIEVLRWLCEQFTSADDYANGEKYLEQLNGRDEVQPKDMLELGKTRLKLEKFGPAAEALQRYLGAVHEPPSQALGLLELSKAQIGQKDFDAAQKSVDQALSLQPEGKNSGEARIVAGQIQEARGNFDEAAKLYMSVAVILDDEEVTPRALELAVKAYQRAGKDAEAKKTLNLLQSRYPEYFQRQKLAK